ncbi:2-oxoglutarate-dependent dioxygenase [Quillaja saponaria]|uniref:2-oxoglutarate-dependent dioxygenase n=1 Tax=Quillaja saponaria TaxID=32244 RepID=A0AAD7VE97_QUISA|nr:2-oxoglutarate-dependent dioxygenase [Quillaja saponaria]
MIYLGSKSSRDKQWIGVQPIPNALVINFGYALQVISNGKLKSVEHRAVTNSSDTRTSIGFFINPSGDSIIEPAKAITDDASNLQFINLSNTMIYLSIT